MAFKTESSLDDRFSEAETRDDTDLVPKPSAPVPPTSGQITMNQTINEASAWTAGLRLALKHQADAATAVSIADAAGEAARRRNATVGLFAAIGWDLDTDRPLPPAATSSS